MLNSGMENQQFLPMKLKTQKNNLKKRSKLCRKTTQRKIMQTFLF